MASNKFSGRRYRGHYPPYCIKQPPPGPPLAIGAPATKLQCFARWTDLDPTAPGDQTATFNLPRLGPNNRYRGQSAAKGDRLELEVEQIGTSDYWNVNFWIWDQYRNPEDWHWPNVFIDPTKPFDTYTLSDINIHHVDFRLVRATA